MITKEPLGPANPHYNHACGGFTQILIRQDGAPLLQLYGWAAKLEGVKLVNWAKDIEQAFRDEGMPEEFIDMAVGMVLSQKLVGEREGYNRCKQQPSNEELAS